MIHFGYRWKSVHSCILLPGNRYKKTFPLISLRKQKDHFNINSLRGAVEQINIANTHIYLRFQYCLDETSTRVFVVNCELTL